MDAIRSKFAGGDQRYLRNEQYLDSGRLAQRAHLHAKCSTAATPWLDWVVPRFELTPNLDVLEVGCGGGWLWAETSCPIPAGIDLTLSDLSPGMVDEAVAAVTRSGVFASVAGESADLTQLPFDECSFDRVIANHMLYHLPDPRRGVSELARVVTTDGVMIAATNGQRHMRELWMIRSRVFGEPVVDRTIDVFGAEVGFSILRDHFCDVRWVAYADELHCTDPDDVLAYICSTPPGEDASQSQLRALERSVAAAFDAGGGSMTITKDVGCFVCRGPRR